MAASVEVSTFPYESHLYRNYELLKSEIQNPLFFKQAHELTSREHAKEIDKLLGFKIAKIEMDLVKSYRPYYMTEDDSNKKKHFQGTETWIGLHPQVLQTPYSEICEFFEILKKYDIKNIVDLGAGYGRLGIVANSYFPDLNFIGYEILEQRLNEANRLFDLLDLANCQVISENILDESFSLPKSDLYFIYDFSNPIDLRVILGKLSEIFFKEKFFFVAKGEGIRSLIQTKYPEFYSLNGVIHRKNWSLYSSYVDLSN